MSGTRRKRREIGLHFTAKGDNKAICDHCKHELSFKTSTLNIRKHFETLSSWFLYGKSSFPNVKCKSPARLARASGSFKFNHTN